MSDQACFITKQELWLKNKMIGRKMITKHPFIPEYPNQEPSYLIEPQPPKGTVNLILKDGKYRAVNKYGDLIGWPIDSPIKPNDEIYQAEEWVDPPRGKPRHILKRRR